MNILSLFTGIGGLDLGIKIALPTSRVVCAVEADRYCQRVLHSRMLDGSLDCCPIYGDVTRFDGRPWRGCVDTIVGGFPCQDISNAGRREGIGGSRSGLWGEMARIIGEVRPRYVFLENVAALVIRGLDAVLADLAALGFNAEWTIVSAADVGAPHLRKRVFILAESQSERHERSGTTRGRRHGPADGNGSLADAQRAERGPDALPRSHSGEGSDGEGQAAGRTGERGIPLADAEEQRRELRPAPIERPGRPAGGGVEPLAHGGGARLQGDGEGGPAPGSVGRDSGAVVEHASLVSEREPDDAPCTVARERTWENTGGGLPLFPPGPADRYAWTEILERTSWLAPAISEAEAERLFRGVAHGFPPGFYRSRAKTRVAELRALGNAVCPLQAAVAFEVLAERLKEGRDGVLLSLRPPPG